MEPDPELEPDPEPDPLARGTDPGSGSAPKCHGSPTLLRRILIPDPEFFSLDSGSGCRKEKIATDFFDIFRMIEREYPLPYICLF